MNGSYGQENWVSYVDGSNGVSVDLTGNYENVTKLGTSDKDTLNEINHVIGTNNADTLTVIRPAIP